jgi:hypothetical protein
MLKQFLKKSGVSVRTEFIWLKVGPALECHEHSNESSGSLKDKKFLELVEKLPSSQEGLCSLEFSKPGLAYEICIGIVIFICVV